MSARSAELISSQSRRGRGNSTVWLDAAEGWGGKPGSRAYVKQQQDYCCRPAWRAWRRTPLLAREFRALQACRKLGLKVPDVLHFERRGQAATLVLAEVENSLPLDQALASQPQAREQMLVAVGTYLGRLHRAGWYHGALYSHHLLICGGKEHTLCLIDFEKARRSRRRRDEDLQRFWRHNGHLAANDRETITRAYREH
jgi:tRNA A-37 threonylcarbamoyl transferase component Bud32